MMPASYVGLIYNGDDDGFHTRAVVLNQGRACILHYAGREQVTDMRYFIGYGLHDMVWYGIYQSNDLTLRCKG